MTPTICQTFAESRLRPKKWVALRYSQGGQWHSASWRECYRTTEVVAGGLKTLDVQRGDGVALMSNTRPEWLYADMAILGLGAITIPIYPSQLASEMACILNDSKPKVLIIEDDSQLKKWSEIAGQCPSIQSVIVITNSKAPQQIGMHWDTLLEGGQIYCDSNPDFFLQSLNDAQLDDVATIIYTSGTTGEPKGVLLTHQQISSEVIESMALLPISEKDCSLTFLPYSHIFGRVESWAAIHIGFTLAFAESIDRLRPNMAEIQPTFLLAVPRIFEKIYGNIMSQTEGNQARKKIFSWAMDVGREVSHYRSTQTAIPLGLLAKFQMAKFLAFDPIQKKLGGRIRFAISGGAPLNPEIAEFFHAANILVLEGYGLTETTAAITLNTPLQYRFGTVGRPIGDVAIRFAPDGEILVKSAKVMREYYNNETATLEVIQDGYFATGDIGKFDDQGFLIITDRKKDLIKTAGGKYVAPQRIEGVLKQNPYISNVLIYGDGEKYIVALLTLNPDQVVAFAREQQISYQDYENLTQHPQVKALAREIVAEANTRLAGYETIKNLAILGKDFTVEEGELTPSLKVKRKFCSLKFHDVIKSLYN